MLPTFYSRLANSRGVFLGSVLRGSVTENIFDLNYSSATRNLASQFSKQTNLRRRDNLLYAVGDFRLVINRIIRCMRSEVKMEGHWPRSSFFVCCWPKKKEKKEAIHLARPALS